MNTTALDDDFTDRGMVINMLKKRGVRASMETWNGNGTRVAISVPGHKQITSSVGGDAEIVDFIFDESGELLRIEAWVKEHHG